MTTRRRLDCGPSRLDAVPAERILCEALGLLQPEGFFVAPRSAGAVSLILLSFSCALFLLAPAAACFAAEETPADVRIASLVRRLGSDAYSQRDSAEEELAALGSSAREQLTAATENPDPEVRLRAKKLLERMKVTELWSASRVRCQAEQTSAAAALAMISQQTGNRVLAGDQYGTFQDRMVTLNFVEGTFWEVLDELCRESGNRVRPHYDTRRPGLVLAAGALGKNPVAHAGPVRMQMVRARRSFSEEFDYERLNGEQSHTFQFELQAMWEDRFSLIAYRSHPELVEAVTDSGARLVAAQAAASGWNVAGSGTRQLSMSLRLQPPATACKELDTLKLKWGLVAIGDRASIEVADFDSTAPHFQDDVELVVRSFRQGPGDRWEACLLLVRELVIPEPQELLFEEIDVALFDDQGRAFHRQGQSNTLSEEGAMVKLVFAGESPTAKPKVLRLTYPRIRTQKDLEVVFRHVPLPRARPE